MPSVRRLSRRKIAVLIRVRQELHKRLDALLPAQRGDDPIVQLFDRSFLARLQGDQSGHAVCDALRERARTRYPLAHLTTRAADSLPDRDDILAAANRLTRGNWELFGQAITLRLDAHDWTRHPITGARADDAHWTRVAYMAGIGGGDVKQIWELSRHAELVRMAQAYHLTRDDQYARMAVDLLDRWVRQNPPGRGVHWTSSLEVAFRAIAWCWIWTLTSDSPAWNDTRLGRFLSSLCHHARHIARFDSVHHSPNTHLTGEALGLLYIGLFFPELARANEWSELARTILDEELDEQVLPDGMHFERSSGYHRYTLEFYAHYLMLAGAFGLPATEHLRRRVRDLAEATWLLRRPGGTWPVIGDEDSVNTLRLSSLGTQDQRPVLAVAAAISESRVPNEEVAFGAAWWLLEERDWNRLQDLRRQPSTTASGAGALTSAGYYVGRTRDSTSEWFCLVDAGPHGGDRTGHAHTDLGHVEIAHGTENLVADPGCAVYTTDRVARDLARSERVHACLVVEREPLAVPAGPFSWARLSPVPAVSWNDASDLWWCELHYTRALTNGSITHRRQVVLARDAGVVVCDWITGDARSGVALHWPLGAGVDDLALAGDALTIGQHRVRWASTAGVPGATLEPLARSPGYGQVEPGRLLRIAVDTTAPATVATIFTAATTRSTIVFRERDRVLVTLGNETDSVEVTLAPGVAPSVTDVAATTRSRAEGVLR
jgi:hypothetical protein